MFDTLAKKQILVVDDEQTVAFFLKESLRAADPNWEVSSVSSMKEALAALVRNRYDLMITDLRMPAINGLELMAHVRENWPYTQLFLITAYGTDDLLEEMRKLQVSGYMTKPFDMDEFLTAVRTILETHTGF